MLPAPPSAIAAPPLPSSPGPLPANGMAISPLRPSEPNSSRSPTALNLDQFKSFMLFLSDLKTIKITPPDVVEQKVTALLRYVEGVSPLTFALPRFRLLQQFDGLMIVVSALSCLCTLGSAYEDAQNRLMSFLFIVEMSSDLNPRPSRPIGIFTALRYQLEHAQRTQNRQLALTLLGKYNQHDDTMHTVLADLHLVAPVATWLFHEAVPAVACSISILSAIEDDIGCKQLRAVPGISQRVIHLLGWTSTLTVVSSSLALLPRLDHAELLALGIVPELLAVMRQVIDMGFDSLVLMCLLCLEEFVKSPSHVPSQRGSGSYHSSVNAEIALTDIIGDLLTTLRGLERSSRSRHLVKGILSVLCATFQDSELGSSSLSYCRQFRSLNGPTLLQELIFSMDHTRRLTQQAANDQMEFILQPDNWDDLTKICQSGFKSPSKSHSSTSMDIDASINPANDFEQRLPKSTPGALVPSTGSSKSSAKSQDQLDVVVDLYQTLNEATRDAISESLDSIESIADSQATDLFWVSTSLIHNLHEPALILRAIEYIATLSAALFYGPSSATPRSMSPRNTTVIGFSMADKHLRLVAAVVRRLLTYLEPSWITPHALSQRVPRGPVSHPPPGSDITIPCLSIATSVIQRYLDQSAGPTSTSNHLPRDEASYLSGNEATSSFSPSQNGHPNGSHAREVDHRLAFGAVVINFCLRHVSTPAPPDLELDPELFKPLLALCSYALHLYRFAADAAEFESLIFSPVLTIIAILRDKLMVDWMKLDLDLEWQVLKAIAAVIPEQWKLSQVGSHLSTMDEPIAPNADFDTHPFPATANAILGLEVRVPELIIPDQPLRFWTDSLLPLDSLIASSNSEIALLGLLALSSFISTSRGRQQYVNFVSAVNDSIQLACSRSPTNEMFWNRIVSLEAIYPEK